MQVCKFDDVIPLLWRHQIWRTILPHWWSYFSSCKKFQL